MKVNTEGRIKNLDSTSVHAVSQVSTFGTLPKLVTASYTYRVSILLITFSPTKHTMYK